VIPINDAGELIDAEFVKLLGPKTKLLSILCLSGHRRAAHDRAGSRGGRAVFIDGAQAVPHQSWMCGRSGDFYFSGHNQAAPIIGVLYQALPPYHGGGDMIKSVTFEKTIYNDLPEIRGRHRHRRGRQAGRRRRLPGVGRQAA
jgi:cysteine desulfurase/selenocysteine lyase